MVRLMNTTAIIVARNRKNVWIRLPYLHEHRFLTMPAKILKGHDVGSAVPVTVSGGIIARPAPHSGWTADISEAS